MTAALAPAGSGQEPTTFRNLVAAELRAHLARRRMSNRALARQLGTTPAWIDRRLNGTTAISTDDLEMIGNALGMAPMQLLSGITHSGANPQYPSRELQLVVNEAEVSEPSACRAPNLVAVDGIGDNAAPRVTRRTSLDQSSHLPLIA